MAGAGPTAKHTIVLLQETGTAADSDTCDRHIECARNFRHCAVLCFLCCSDWQFYEGAVRVVRSVALAELPNSASAGDRRLID